MSKVKVSKKDLLRVITEADEYTRWGTSAWKARRRLLSAVPEGSEKSEYLCRMKNCQCVYIHETQRDLLDYCAIPNCGCPGDRSHA